MVEASRPAAIARTSTTGVNVVDVRDVARGHLLALERGRRGERYLLGGADLTLRELFTRSPTSPDVGGLASGSLRGGEGLARTGVANARGGRLARLPMYFSSDKARRELGYEPGPVEPALARAVHEAIARTETIPL